MNYFKLYYAFISKFKDQMFKEGEYTEVHHILPRYAGGTDDQDNLVRLSYRQHVFVHKLWYKATNDPEAQAALWLMQGIPENKKLFLCSIAGKIGGRKNVESGHMKYLSERYGSENGKRNVENGTLDRIRPLANTPERQRKLRELHALMKGNGHMERLVQAGNAAWRGSHHTEEFKQARSELYKERYRNDPSTKQRILAAVEKSKEALRKKSKEHSDSVIMNAERNEEFLHKTSSKSLNKFISPEGLCFDSPLYAAGYYGNGVTPSTIENWCKRAMHGWKRIPKDSV